MNKTNTNRKNHTYNYKGVPLLVSQLKKILDRSTSAIYHRINNGYTVDAVLRRGKCPKMYKIGKESMTAKEISVRYGISLQTVYNKVGKFPTRSVFSAKMFIKF